MQLSAHFSLEEACTSDTAARKGINNTPPNVLLPVMLNTATHMENVRALLGYPIHINSWYRCIELNAAVGGARNSQHPLGEAVDFICPEFGSPAFIAKHIVDNLEVIQFDQLIMEHTWVHISWKSQRGAIQRNEVLSLLATGGYARGITDKNGAPIKFLDGSYCNG